MLGVSRCSTISERSALGLRAPSSVQNSTDTAPANEPQDHASVAVALYKKAAIDAKTDETRGTACAAFLSLASDQELPEEVRLLARVRAVPTCPQEKLSPLPAATPPRWLAEDAARAELEAAQIPAQDQTTLAQRTRLALALRAVSYHERTQKSRLERAEAALAIFREIQNKDETRATIDRILEIAPRRYLDRSLSASFNARRDQARAFSVANDLRNARQFEQARAIYEIIATDTRRSPQDRIRALDSIRMTYKLELKTKQFLDASNRWMKFARAHFLAPGLKNKDTSLLRTYLDNRILYARAVWTDHKPAVAERILLQTEKEVGSLVPVHESMLIRARIAEERGDFAKMADILGKVAIDRLPDRATKAKFLWFKGWNLRRLGPTRSQEALAALEDAQKVEDSLTALTRNKYWSARILREIGQTDKASEAFSELARDAEFGYYGILAQNELKRPFSSLHESVVQSEPYDPRRRSPLPDSLRVPIDWFVALGELETGRRFLESRPAREVWDTEHSLERKEATLVQLSRLEQHILVTTRIGELSAEDQKTLLSQRPELLFPLPYEERIVTESTRQKVPAELVYSIMRQESLFNPFARSHADAFGLMQLIPEMAAKAAKSIDLTLAGHEDLYDPDKNIALGTVFLKELFQKYDNRFILAVSAYNANDRAIQGWLRTRMRADPLEFIEEIPYEETRLYVRLVLRNFVTYQRRLSRTPVEFPTWTLTLGASL
jgi:soluble lytic murein transglycosylase